MANLTGGSFKRISPEDIKVRKSSLNQLVDIIQEDISGSATRRQYAVYATGGIGPGITSSLYHTVYDQDFSLQTANPIFDVTVGLYLAGGTVTDARTATDSAGKFLFRSSSMMMREKVDVYKQYAGVLLGDSTAAFYSPYGSTQTATTPGLNDRIDEALFVSFKRLFARDRLKKETFAIRLNRTGSVSGGTITGSAPSANTQLQNSLPAGTTGSNLDVTSEIGNAIFTDLGAASNVRTTFGGDVGNLVNAANSGETVGLIFYDHGTVVLDMSKTFMHDQHMSGVIRGMSNNAYNDILSGEVEIGGIQSTNPNATFVPDLLVSASIDDILNHVCSTRFY